MQKKNPLLTLALSLVISVISHAQANIVRTETGAPGEYLGVSACNVGDWNSDSVDDYAVGSSGFDSPAPNAGKVEIRSGVDGSVITSFTGVETNHYFGDNIDDAGDVNGDGHHDLIIGALGWNSLSGNVYIYSGLDYSLLHIYDEGTLVNYTGRSVAGIGDVNNDGFDDVIVGSPQAGSGGRARVLSGADMSVIYQYNGTSGESIGQEVSGGHDINGDGCPDFMISGQNNARIHSGADGTVLHSFVVDLHSVTHGIPDANLDGCDDFAYVRRVDGVAEFSICSGNDGTEFWGTTFPVGSSMTCEVQAIEDLDGDCIAELIVGMPQAFPGFNTNTGLVYVLNGRTGEILYSFEGTSSFGEAGSAVGSLGDVNNDGHAHLFFGHPYDDSPGSDAGSLTVFKLPISGKKSLPYFENFDALSPNIFSWQLLNSTLPPGWCQPLGDQYGTVAPEYSWYVSTGQISFVSGPIGDSTPGSGGQGNFIHINDYDDEPSISTMSPMLDLSSTVTPTLAFKLFSHNRVAIDPQLSENSLAIDILDTATGNFTLDVSGPLAHNPVDDWSLVTVDLSAFAGKCIRVRFRATSANLGNSTNTHNIAVDDVAVFDADSIDAGGQIPRPGVAVFDLGNSRASYFGSVGASGPYESSLAPGDTLRMSFEGEPNQGLVCYFGPRNPGHTDLSPVGRIDCGQPDNNFDGIPESLFVVGDGLVPLSFLDLLFNTGPGASTFIDFPVPQSLPSGEFATFQCLFGSSSGVRLSNAVTLYIN